MRVAAEIALSKEERRRLETWASTRSTSVRLRERARRARIVLMAAEGMTNKEIAAELQVDANKVGRWRTRVAKEGTSSIEKERPRVSEPRRQEHQEAGAVAQQGDRGGRVAPGDCSPEALTRSGQGDFHHPAPPLMCLVATPPISARQPAAGEAGSVPAVCRTAPT